MTRGGWHPNPDGTPTMRYWDGDRWTDHVDTPSETARGQSWAPAPTATVDSTAAATASLVLGILSVVVSRIGVVGFGGGVLAVIFAVVGLRQARHSHRGESQALAGLILGLFAIVVAITITIVLR